MRVGDREESLEEKKKRHIKETQEEKACWENEKEYAKNKNDLDYAKYCEQMLAIDEMILNQLNSDK